MFEPSLCEPRSPFPGNGILQAETKAFERASSAAFYSAETKRTRRCPPNRANTCKARKSPLAGKCVVDLRGLELRARQAVRYRTGLRRRKSKDSRPFCPKRPFSGSQLLGHQHASDRKPVIVILKLTFLAIDIAFLHSRFWIEGEVLHDEYSLPSCESEGTRVLRKTGGVGTLLRRRSPTCGTDGGTRHTRIHAPRDPSCDSWRIGAVLASPSGRREYSC